MARKEDIYYDSRDNRTKIHAVSWVPEKGEIKGILQIVHGMAEDVDKYDGFAEFMVSKGFIVVGNDHLGHGKTANSEKEHGYFCAKDAETVLVRDVHRLKKMIQNAYPGRPYFIIGQGMGSLMVRKYIMEYGKGIDGAIIMGTCMKSLSFLNKEIMWAKVLSKLHGDNYRNEQIQKRVCLPEDEKNSFLLSLNGYITMLEMMSYIEKNENYEKTRTDLPLLLVSGEQDIVGDKGEATKSVYKTYLELGYNQVDMKLYPNGKHELLNETGKEEIYKDLEQWICDKIVGLQN